MRSAVPAASGARLVSVGYAGRTVTELCGELADLGVATLVDVRLNAISRRRGFSKGALQHALNVAGIEYLHEPLLGNPKDNRHPFWTGEVALGRKRFRQRLENGSAEALDRVTSLASRSSVAILCVEREERLCHRQVILEAVASAVPGLPVTLLL